VFPLSFLPIKALLYSNTGVKCYTACSSLAVSKKKSMKRWMSPFLSSILEVDYRPAIYSCWAVALKDVKFMNIFENRLCYNNMAKAEAAEIFETC
jgi:hypothetical protein